MQSQLSRITDRRGQPGPLHELAWPPAIFSAIGHRLLASDGNFLILNAVVFVPLYCVNTDTAALTVRQHAFPNDDVVPNDCRALIEQFGSLHGVTVPLPADAMKGI